MRQTKKTTIFHFVVGWGLFFLSYSLLIAVNGSLYTLSIPCLSLAERVLNSYCFLAPVLPFFPNLYRDLRIG